MQAMPAQAYGTRGADIRPKLPLGSRGPAGEGGGVLLAICGAALVLRGSILGLIQEHGMDIKPNIENRCETSFGTGTRTEMKPPRFGQKIASPSACKACNGTGQKPKDR